jgi:hypothetical protein
MIHTVFWLTGMVTWFLIASVFGWLRRLTSGRSRDGRGTADYVRLGTLTERM